MSERLPDRSEELPCFSDGSPIIIDDPLIGRASLWHASKYYRTFSDPKVTKINGPWLPMATIGRPRTLHARSQREGPTGPVTAFCRSFPLREFTPNDTGRFHLCSYCVNELMDLGIWDRTYVREALNGNSVRRVD